MTQVQSRRSRGTIRPLHIAIILLVLVTALIHLQRGIGMSVGGSPGGPPGGGPGGPPGGAPDGGFNIMQVLPLPLPTLFLLNGIGYLVLAVALYLRALHRYQRIVRWLLIIFTAVTIILYFLVVGFALNLVGIIDKVVEFMLIMLLLIEDRQPVPAPVSTAPR